MKPYPESSKAQKRSEPFLAGPQRRELIRTGKIAIAVMKDVGDGKVIAEGGDDESNGRKDHRPEDCDTGAAGGFTDALSARIIRHKKSQQAAAKRINAQRQREQQGKTTDLRHGEPQRIFSESYGGQANSDWNKGRLVESRHASSCKVGS